MLRKLLKSTGLILALLGALWFYGERGQLLRPSTRAFMQAAGGWRAIFSRKWWEGYVYGRWTNLYIGLPRRWYFRYVDNHDSDDPLWAAGYHGKVMSTADAQALISVDRPIPLQSLSEQIIPFPVARDIVLNSNPAVVAYECVCRATAANPCSPSQVCMVVGQPFVDFILEHHPDTSRRLTTEAALQLLQDEHDRGHFHAAYFKDAMLGRFYAICNCCSCCCAGLQAMQGLGVPMLMSSGYVAAVDIDDCLACGVCEDACPFDAIALQESAVAETALIDWAACLGCGVCVDQCSQEAITLILDERKGQPLQVEALFGNQNIRLESWQVDAGEEA
ncbi:4Fe-4S binding protein [Chloroflexota bacterium]